MSKKKELEIKASNVFRENNIVLRVDSFNREVGIIALPKNKEDQDATRAIYVYKDDFAKLISSMFEFFTEIAAPIEIAALFTEISQTYIEALRLKK